MKHWLTAGLAGVAIGVAGSLALRERQPPPPPPALPAGAPPACECGSGTAPAARDQQQLTPLPAAATGTEPAGRIVASAAYAVCAREETPARLSRLHWTADQPALWALHCGPSVHVIALRERGAELVPERLARIEVPRPGPGETGAAAKAIAADIDGDGRADLVVPTLLVDRSGAPRAGALLQLRQRSQGGLLPPARLIEAAPSAVVALDVDAQPGQDLALLQRNDVSNARPDEIWLVQGGAAPLRIGRLTAGLSAGELTALDLDRDHRSDLAVASATEGKLRLFLSRRGPLAQSAAPLEIALPGVQAALEADVDGDRSPDLLIAASDRIVALLAREEVDVEPKQLAVIAGLRDLAVMDVNADGKPDIVGYAHPELVVLTQTDDLVFSGKPLAAIRGQGSVLDVQTAALDRDPRPDAVIATVSGDSVQLSIARNLESGTTIELTTSGSALSNAAWLEQFAAP